MSNGDTIYFRYRGGRMSVRINDDLLHHEILGDDLDGFMSEDDVIHMLESLFPDENVMITGSSVEFRSFEI